MSKILKLVSAIVLFLLCITEVDAAEEYSLVFEPILPVSTCMTAYDCELTLVPAADMIIAVCKDGICHMASVRK
jgi:hypothetical protein